MIRVIMGKKGSGKTKQMIEMINAAAVSYTHLTLPTKA